MNPDKHTVALKEEEQINLTILNSYLHSSSTITEDIVSITRFTGGYSNLTYLLQTATKEYVLRTPPRGANIKSAHDMGREFRVLSSLKPHYTKVPLPILYCEDSNVIGTSFYVMEKISGNILRAHNAPKMNISRETFHNLSIVLIDNLAALHALNIKTTQLEQLGKPDGYVQRQVEGWTKRYFTAETDTIASMNAVAQWLQQNQPPAQSPAFLHNDYKYDNIILNEDLSEILGVLDWEMATVGDPLMDLGATLAYWFEDGEGDVFKQYNLTWLPGNATRKELIDRYASQTGRDLSGIVFYYVFGLFKNAVIAQQIYHRWKQGHSSDARFGALLPMIQLLGERAARAIERGV